MLLRIGLGLADFVVNALPAGVVYGVADLAGDAWRRFSPARRRLVAANLKRVCAATGRPTNGAPFRALVRDAFRHHARYYAEILRSPHYDRRRISEMVQVDDLDRYVEIIDRGPCVFVSWHLGNFEPFAVVLAGMGRPAMAPAEEIEPPELFEFLSARRGSGTIELVPLSRSRSALARRLREGGIVGVLGDRVIGAGGGIEVTVFGHPVTVPAGPATLAVTNGVPVIVGRCLRVGPDQFHGEGEVVELPASGDRRADITEVTHRLAKRLEHDLAAAPEQWWGAFQQFWKDLAA